MKNVTSTVLKKVEDSNKRYNLFKTGDTIVVGLSGGADSVVLLHILNSLRSKYSLNLIAAHINHRIRPGEAERDQEFSKSYAESLCVPFCTKTVEIREMAREQHKGEEEVGRQVRYSFFNELCGINGKVATAHHANDNVETMLMKLFRGAGLNGMTAIPRKRDNIIRPLLSVTRSEIEEYAKENNLEYVIDSTNLKAVYTRNKVRLHLIPYIEENFNNNIIETISNNIESFSEDNNYLNKVASYEYLRAECFPEKYDSAVYFDIEQLRYLDIAIRKRIYIKAIKKIWDTFDSAPSNIVVESIDSVLFAESGTSINIGKETIVRREYRYLIVEKEVKDNNFFVPTSEPLYLGENNIHSRKFIVKIVDENFYIFENDYQLYVGSVESFYNNHFVVRNRMEGDKYIFKDGKTKKLKDKMIDDKIPRDERAKTLLLASDKGVHLILR